MELNLLTSSGAQSKSIQVAETAFAKPFNEALIHQVVTAYLAGSRAGTKGQKSRSTTRGGGIKPWRQKGTGRARAGTIRSPLWRSGGKTFAAVTRDHSQKVNRKMYQGAMCSILSELVRQDRLLVVEDFTVEEPKTRVLIEKFKQLGVSEGKNILLVTDEINEHLILSARNLHWVGVCATVHLNPASLIAFDKVLITLSALKRIEEVLQ